MIHILSQRYPLPKPYTTDVLTDEQIIFIAQQLPSPKAITGRPAYSNQELLPGILRVLRSGCRWRDLNLLGYPDGSTHWRRLRLWRKGPHFRRLWQRILTLLGEQNPAEKEMRLKRFSIDGTLLQSFEFRDKTGYSGKHRRVGVKASLVVDATGLPVSAVLARGNAHDLSLAEESVSRLRGYDYFRSSLLADKGYDSKTFRRFAFNHGIKPNIPKRSYTKEREHPYKFHLYRYDTEEAKHRCTAPHLSSGNELSVVAVEVSLFKYYGEDKSFSRPFVRRSVPAGIAPWDLLGSQGGDRGRK